MKIKSAQDLGIQFADNSHKMVGQDGAYSIKTNDGLLFYFGDTLIGERIEGESIWYPGGIVVGHRDMGGLGKFEKMLNNTGALIKLPYKEKLEYNYVLDNNKQIKQLIPLWDSEEPDWIRVWCLHGVEINNKLYLFFVKVKTKDEGIFPVNFDIIGSGIAVAKSGSWNFERVLYNGSDILWQENEPHFAAAVLSEGDYLYLYGVVQDNNKVQNCYLARVIKTEIENLASYKYFSDGNWIKNIKEASVLFTGMPNELSVSYNNYLKKYLAVHSLDLSGKIVARTSDTLWGRWSEPVELFHVEMPEQNGLPYPTLIYAGKEHPYLSKENGKILYVTYIEFEEYYPHLLEITLE